MLYRDEKFRELDHILSLKEAAVDMLVENIST